MLKIKSKKLVESVNLSGRGGKEEKIVSLFNNLTRKNEILFDAVDARGNKHEFKKQADQQWFDLGKYHELSKEDKKIFVNFIIHEKGKITKIACVRLGNFIDRLTSTSRYEKDGWTKNMIKFMYTVKQKFPSFQTKASLRVKRFVLDNPDIVHVIYEKNNFS